MNLRVLLLLVCWAFASTVAADDNSPLVEDIWESMKSESENLKNELYEERNPSSIDPSDEPPLKKPSEPPQKEEADEPDDFEEL